MTEPSVVAGPRNHTSRILNSIHHARIVTETGLGIAHIERTHASFICWLSRRLLIINQTVSPLSTSKFVSRSLDRLLSGMPRPKKHHITPCKCMHHCPLESNVPGGKPHHRRASGISQYFYTSEKNETNWLHIHLGYLKQKHSAVASSANTTSSTSLSTSIIEMGTGTKHHAAS